LGHIASKHDIYAEVEGELREPLLELKPGLGQRSIQDGECEQARKEPVKLVLVNALLTCILKYDRY